MIDVDKAIAAAREHVHRSIGQRARWAIVAIRGRVAQERESLDLSLEIRFTFDKRLQALTAINARLRGYDPFYREGA